MNGHQTHDHVLKSGRVTVHEQAPISDHDKGEHVGHRVRRKGQGSYFRCDDCNVQWQMKRNSAIARARMLR